MRREAERNRKVGKKVRVGYMKIWIEEKLWIWDEIKDELKEWQGREVRVAEGGAKGECGVEKGIAVF